MDGETMPNDLFQSVVEHLGFLGDIFSVGIVKKGISKQGADPESVTCPQMIEALDDHIIPSVQSFVTPQKADEVRRKIQKTISRAS